MRFFYIYVYLSLFSGETFSISSLSYRFVLRIISSFFFSSVLFVISHFQFLFFLSSIRDTVRMKLIRGQRKKEKEKEIYKKTIQQVFRLFFLLSRHILLTTKSRFENLNVRFGGSFSFKIKIRSIRTHSVKTIQDVFRTIEKKGYFPS